MLRFVFAVVAFALFAGSAAAAQKAAVFPFQLVIPLKEEDFFSGSAKPSEAEQARLKLAHEEFTKLMTASGQFEFLDLTPMAAEIEAKSPIQDCKGCEIDFAKRVGAEIAYVVVVEKASDTVLNMNVSEIDVGRAGVLRSFAAVVQGNTDSAWLGGVRWMVKNRLIAKKEAAP